MEEQYENGVLYRTFIQGVEVTNQPATAFVRQRTMTLDEARIIYGFHPLPPQP
jgi:hypothetical protein